MALVQTAEGGRTTSRPATAMRVGRSGVAPAKVTPALGALGEQHSCLTRWNGLGMIQDRVPRTPPSTPTRSHFGPAALPALAAAGTGAEGGLGQEPAVCGRAAAARCVFYP